MSTIVGYKGLSITSPPASGDGGLLLINDIKTLADRIGPSYSGITSPGINNDGVDTAGLGTVFYPNSRWVNTSSQNEYLCISNTTGAAVWKITTGGSGTDATKLPLAGGTLTGNVQNDGTLAGYTNAVGTVGTAGWAVNVDGTISTINNTITNNIYNIFAKYT